MQPYPQAKPQAEGVYIVTGKDWVKPLEAYWRFGRWEGVVSGHQFIDVTGWNFPAR